MMLSAVTPHHISTYLHIAPASAPPFNSDLPRKRQKRYIPGGLGGGGRWVEEELADGMAALPARPQTERKRRNPGTPVGRPRRGRSIIEKTPKPTSQPTYNSSADAAATMQSDGYKPREERGWEEFHPDLDLEQQLLMFTADEVDGVTAEERQEQDRASEAAGQEDGQKDGQGPASRNSTLKQDNEMSFTTPSNKRRPGRPHRRPEAMLNGLGLVSPPAPKIIPLPTQKPKERLSLAKPSYRLVKTFDTLEADKNVHDNYVTQSMKNVGYQESDKFERPRHLMHEVLLLSAMTQGLYVISVAPRFVISF